MNIRTKVLKAWFFVLVANCFFGCNPDEQTPTLTIYNNSNTDKVISSVRLIGYEFTSLNITFGSSHTFILDKGMPGGYTNINVDINFNCGNRGWTVSDSVNFTETNTATINFLHCENTTGYCRGVCFN